MDCKLVIFEISDDHSIFLVKGKERMGIWAVETSKFPKRLSWARLRVLHKFEMTSGVLQGLWGVRGEAGKQPQVPLRILI